MDRALKERIVGATVLVVIAVLVVPVFLDGPADEPGIVTETVTLPGQSEQSTKRQTIVLERDREEPVPQPGATRKEAREPAPAASTAADPPQTRSTATRQPEKTPAPEPQRREEPPAEKPASGSKSGSTSGSTSGPAPDAGARQAPPADSATGMWAVQLGSFSNEQNAERLAAELRKKGYAAFLSRVQTSSEVLHRVRVGPQQNRESAEQVAAKLGGEGHKGQVVPHP